MKSTLKLIAMFTLFVSIVALAFVSLIIISVACTTTAREEKYSTDDEGGNIWVNEAGELVVIGKVKAIA